MTAGRSHDGKGKSIVIASGGQRQCVRVPHYNGGSSSRNTAIDGWLLTTTIAHRQGHNHAAGCAGVVSVPTSTYSVSAEALNPISKRILTIHNDHAFAFITPRLRVSKDFVCFVEVRSIEWLA
ncbi:hypothetical protein OPV22_002745 [Ensete ventricosum]|uniref:Uncharacterized protein n=1 Tax=Ensete ventricosum TaxID=4639 RepID=A0AAV8RYT8_ENSVE|nr:hypothetical protein OPV22_002745 [Ensete ventricosum]